MKQSASEKLWAEHVDSNSPHILERKVTASNLCYPAVLILIWRTEPV
jgi:hypothetical protein